MYYMMEESAFENTDSSEQFGEITLISSKGATSRCKTVRKHGKRMFMKHIRPELKGNRKYREAFIKEFEIGFNLEHPNIVRYYELDEDQDGIYMLMEFVDGVTLTDLCNAKSSYLHKAENVRKLMNQLLDTLHYIHSNQILHLDLKPDNILLTKVGYDLKLIDFGFSYSDEFNTTMGYTDSFASPEQQKRLKEYDIRTDLYAVGRVAQYICEHCDTEKSSALLAFADRCTKENPGDRFQNAAEAKEWLNRHWKGRSNTLWISMIATLAVICSVVIYAYFSRQKESAIEEKKEAWVVSEQATEKEVVHVMDSMYRDVYRPVTDLWENNGVEADCRALSYDELMQRMGEVTVFNNSLQHTWEIVLVQLTNRFPKQRVFIYKNYKQYLHPEEADSLEKWMDIARERAGM